MMDKNWILIGLIMLVFLVSIVHADTCDKADTEESVLYGTQAEDTGRWAAAARNYGDAATCYGRVLHDYDNAIKYELKFIEMHKKLNMSYGGSYVSVATYYSKKGIGFEKEIRENCNLAEEELLKEINADKLYGGSDYKFLSDCFNLANDTDKTCLYCSKSNDYTVKKNIGSIDCVVHYGCPKSSNPTSNNAGSSSDNAGSFPVVGGLIVIVLIVVAFFLLKGRKRKAK